MAASSQSLQIESKTETSADKEKRPKPSFLDLFLFVVLKFPILHEGNPVFLCPRTDTKGSLLQWSAHPRTDRLITIMNRASELFGNANGMFDDPKYPYIQLYFLKHFQTIFKEKNIESKVDTKGIRNTFLEIDPNQEALMELCIQEFKGQNYYQRFYDKINKEYPQIKEIYSINSDKDESALRDFVQDSIKKLVHAKGFTVQETKQDQFLDGFGIVIRVNITPTQMEKRNELYQVIHDLGLIEFDMHRQYFCKIGLSTDCLVAYDIDKFIRCVIELILRPASESRTQHSPRKFQPVSPEKKEETPKISNTEEASVATLHS